MVTMLLLLALVLLGWWLKFCSLSYWKNIWLEIIWCRVKGYFYYYYFFFFWGVGVKGQQVLGREAIQKSVVFKRTSDYRETALTASQGQRSTRRLAKGQQFTITNKIPSWEANDHETRSSAAPPLQKKKKKNHCQELGSAKVTRGHFFRK